MNENGVFILSWTDRLRNRPRSVFCHRCSYSVLWNRDWEYFHSKHRTFTISYFQTYYIISEHAHVLWYNSSPSSLLSFSYPSYWRRKMTPILLTTVHYMICTFGMLSNASLLYFIVTKTPKEMKFVFLHWSINNKKGRYSGVMGQFSEHHPLLTFWLLFPVV